MSPADIPVVFIHGIKGGQLVDQHQKTRWLGLKQVLGIDKQSLALPLEWQDGLQANDGLMASQVLKNVAGQKIYSPFIKWIEKEAFDFYPFSYDWRRSLPESVAALKRFIKPIVADKGPVLLIAHSMGGLVSFRLLADAPSLFQGALFAGVPFGGGVDFARDMHKGVSAGFNKSITDCAAHFSWPAPYVFFPLATENNRVLDPNGKAVNFNWYDPQDWQDRQLSVFKDQQLNPEINLQHLSQALKQAEDYRKNLVPSEALLQAKLPIAILSASNKATINKVLFDANNKQQPWCFNSQHTELGDGRVTFPASHPPSPLEYRSFLTKKSHGDLMNDREAISSALHWLLGHSEEECEDG
jgi:pimeloyl-ACP methyl ester carboxylesterase